MNAAASLRYFLPELFLLTGAFFMVFLDLFSSSKKALPFLGVMILVFTMFLAKPPFQPAALFFGFFGLDGFTHILRMLILAVTAVTLIISSTDSELPEKYAGEYVSLFLFMAFALILMAGAVNLMMIFMSIEFVSLLSYILVGFLKNNPRSKEASLKYLLYGSVASAMMLYGFSLLYGISGSLEVGPIMQAVGTGQFKGITLIAFILSITGIGFKISMAPFHMWAPDVYESAPTPVSGFLTVAPKAVGFLILARLLLTVFAPIADHSQFLLVALSILTMTLGNLTAIAQSNIKRLLAFSSIAQAGYLLMGIAPLNRMGMISVQIYLIAYALTNLGAFAAIVAVSRHTHSEDLLSYSGLAKRSPFLAAALTLFLLSLTGLPPLAGFIAKFFVFSTVIERGMYGFAIAAALNSAVAAFYYFKIIRAMYLTAPLSEEPVALPLGLKLGLSGLLIGIFYMGLCPNQLLLYFMRHF